MREGERTSWISKSQKCINTINFSSICTHKPSDALLIVLKPHKHHCKGYKYSVVNACYQTTLARYLIILCNVCLPVLRYFEMLAMLCLGLNKEDIHLFS